VIDRSHDRSEPIGSRDRSDRHRNGAFASRSPSDPSRDEAIRSRNEADRSIVGAIGSRDESDRSVDESITSCVRSDRSRVGRDPRLERLDPLAKQAIFFAAIRLIFPLFMPIERRIEEGK
jgi:hypothetical protein